MTGNRYEGKPRRSLDPPVVPHPWSIRDCDAADVAEYLLDRIRVCGFPLALFLHTDGKVETCATRSIRFDALLAQSPRSLVGVYNRAAYEELIVADLKAREE